ncbi:unnamed protein product [Notodromas monacha]|uniref:Mitochondrial ribosomal protein S9 n=1 Tax=Notodromas monacha TaxID=399045 RepID=A0A7R9BZ01_9CRUS|nr:unnamed protein product [Notodromas monacha]CAG0923060.1 unnamed protein product [Notodromas monacha]
MRHCCPNFQSKSYAKNSDLSVRMALCGRLKLFAEFLAAGSHTASLSYSCQVRLLSSTSHRSEAAVIPVEKKDRLPPEIQENEETGKKPMSKAMKAYLERAREHELFMAEEKKAFQIGRRHLANMMGLEESSMTQEDMDAAVSYLFPSGLFEPKARPFMRDPEIVFPKRKAAEFDESGRPHHTLFYTQLPNFYGVMHDICRYLEECDSLQSAAFRKARRSGPPGTGGPVVIKDEDKITVKGTQWLRKPAVEARLLEAIDDKRYAHLTGALDRLLAHPFAHTFKPFIESWRQPMFVDVTLQEVAKEEFDEDGRKFCRGEAKRKWAYARVKIYAAGTGVFSVNGHEYLPDVMKTVQEREVVSFPLLLTGLLGQVDVHCERAELGQPLMTYSSTHFWNQSKSPLFQFTFHVLNQASLSNKAGIGTPQVEGGYRVILPGFYIPPVCKGDEIKWNLGYSARAGAMRLAMSRALTGLVDEDMRKRMRLAGLLTEDMRYRERKRPGHDGARKKWTWKKR